jgi:hypothetical protein
LPDWLDSAAERFRLAPEDEILLRRTGIELRVVMADGLTESVRDDRGAFDPDFVARVTHALELGDGKLARGLTRDLHAADLAELIGNLGQDERVRLIALLGKNFDVEALAELDVAARDELMEALPNEVIASAIKKLDTDDALYLIEDLEDDDQREILAKISKQDRAALTRALDYPEYTTGRLAGDRLHPHRQIAAGQFHRSLCDRHRIPSGGHRRRGPAAAVAARPQDRSDHGRGADGLQSDRSAG